MTEAEKTSELQKIGEKVRESSVSEFKPTERGIKTKIISHIRKYPGSIINEISAHTKLHRNTVNKYLSQLVKSKIVHQKKIGTSTVSYLSRISRRLKE